jgi:hypothetical protein
MKSINKTIQITIDPLYDSTSIFISLEVEIEDSGVLFNKSNLIYYDGAAIFQGESLPSNQKVVNKGSDLKGKRVVLLSRYNIIAPTEGDEKFPKVNWKPNLEAGDHTLYDAVESVTSDDNMFKFNIIFEFN